jgi:hypothetical protein
MLDQALLTTILKLALDTDQIKPDEVMAILQRKSNNSTEDKNTETVDSEILDNEAPSSDDKKNDEGKLLEQSFKELEVEDAIEEAKENKQLQGGEGSSENLLSANNATVQKVATVWEQLKERYQVKDTRLQVKFK